MNALKLLYHYHRTKRLAFTDPAKLHAHQQKQLDRFIKGTLTKSPYFAKWVHKPLAEFPLMDKETMMNHFDDITTTGLSLNDVLDCAIKAEQSRDFTPTLHGYSVGLSSGTSGKRGVFLVSPDEQAQWAGVILAKLLPNGLFHKERIAFFLRANNNLYRTVRTPSICFEFFDLFGDFELAKKRLCAYRPTILVAPAQVLSALASDERLGQLLPKLVISVAEVLDPQTKALLTKRFGKVGEVYQATEGFLGCTCKHGTLHLNEEYLHIEKQMLDDRRFIPIITDFSRKSQPIVRYRLDDVLVLGECGCGLASTAIARIEGRWGDTLSLVGRDGSKVPIFADVCERIFAQVLPLHTDYELTQSDEHTLCLVLDDSPNNTKAMGANTDTLLACQQQFVRAFDGLGVDTAKLVWHTKIDKIHRPLSEKRRRIKKAH